MSKYKQRLGAWGEKIASQYYQKLGFEIIAKNFSKKCGELDLILKKDHKILIVEVKTRTSSFFGFGEESISNKKLKNITNTYQIFATQNNLVADFQIEICVIEKNNANYTILIFKI